MSSKKMYNFNDDEVDLNKDDEIRAKKIISDFMKEVRSENKNTTCYTCGNKTTSFCNSHSIPKFILKNIAKDGQVATIGSIIKGIRLDGEMGANKAGTFRLICTDCDSKLFADYENKNKYDTKEISQKMLAQIAMKTYLKEIDKKLTLTSVYKKMMEKYILARLLVSHQYRLERLDLNDYKNEFYYAKKYLDSKSGKNAYYLPYYKKLDYKVPLAFQGRISLVSDFREAIVNNPYNLFSFYKPSFLHIAIFPFADYSLIMLFTKDGDKRHINFFKDLNSMSLDEQLQAISYLLFAYSEEVYFDKESIVNIPKEDFKKLKNDTGKTFHSYEKNPKKRILLARDSLSLSNYTNFPNLLDKDYLGY